MSGTLCQGQPGVIGPLTIAIGIAAVRKRDPDHLRHGFSQQPELPLAGRQRIRQLLPLGDVLHDARQCQRSALFVVPMPPFGPDRSERTVRAPDAALEVPVGTAGGRVAETPVHVGAIVRHDMLQEHVVGPELQRLLVAEDPVVQQGAHGNTGAQIQFPGADAERVQREIPTLFTVRQAGFRALQPRDIQDDTAIGALAAVGIEHCLPSRK